MIENPHELNSKVAVLIFNLGGPNKLNEVEKYLFNLFYDKRIINLPKIPRYLLAKYISKKRKHKAKEIYKLIGGKSPINQNTLSQAINLQKKLIENYPVINNKGINWRVFFAMRHSEPKLNNVFKEIIEFDPENVILLPLYPQYSTTTTESFFDEWRLMNKNIKNNWNILPIYDYHNNERYISACSNLIKNFIKSNNVDINNTKLLFSAHGLPKSIIKKGDPYQKQIEKCVELITKNLLISFPNLNFKICYQSKVGSSKWLEPSVENEILNCKKDSLNVMIFPISFVSEHSETIVELDIELKEFAKNNNIENYYRIPTLSIEDLYISCLAELCFSKIY